MENLEDYALNEALRIKWVVRNGKRVKKWVTTKKGRYRVAYDENGNPKEVRITATERRKRKIGQRRGKLKRKSRIGLIELKRRRSFIARRNAGLQHYNKKLPDIVFSRGPDGHLPKFQGPDDERTIHPNMKESLLLEAPHSYLFTDENGNDWCFDFFSELVNDSSWLGQVIDIYTKNELVSINPDYREQGGEIYEIDDDIKAQITDNLIDNIEFINMAAHDYVLADDALQIRFRNSVPAKLYAKMLPMINVFTAKLNK